MKKINYLNFILLYQIVRLKANSLLLKRTTLLFILILLSLSSFAQLDRNTWIVGGSGTFTSINDDFSSNTVSTEYKRTNLQLNPKIGYFIIDKLAVGLKSSIWWEKDKGLSSNSLTTSESIRLDYGPFFRYYFLPQEKPFNILTEVSYQYGSVKDIYSKNKGVRNSFAVFVGQAIYFNSTVGMEFLIGYQSQQEKLTSLNNESNYSSIKKGLLVSVGFQIHLTKY